MHIIFNIFVGEREKKKFQSLLKKIGKNPLVEYYKSYKYKKYENIFTIISY